MNKKIQIYIVTNSKTRINSEILTSIKVFFDIEVFIIKLKEFSSISEKKVHLIIFDNIDVDEISYNIIDQIQLNNKYLYTTLITSKYTQKNITKIYNSNIDYVFNEKFDDKYFIAKLKTILKRKSSKYIVSTDLEFKNIKIDILLREVLVDSKYINVTNKEYKIIKLLITNNNVFLKKEFIFKKIWNYEEDTTRLVDQYLHRIKKKLGNEITFIKEKEKGIMVI